MRVYVEPQEPWQPLEHIMRYGFRDYPPPKVEDPECTAKSISARRASLKRWAKVRSDPDFSEL